MDRMDIKKKILEQLLEHMDDSQGSDLHELAMQKKKPLKMGVMEVEMEKKMSPEELKKHELSESPAEEAREKLLGDKDEESKESEDDKDEMSDEEIEEMLQGLK